MIRLRSPDDLACEHQSQVNHWPTRSENHVILGSLVLTHYQRVTDRQTLSIAKSPSSTTTTHVTVPTKTLNLQLTSPATTKRVTDRQTDRHMLSIAKSPATIKTIYNKCKTRYFFYINTKNGNFLIFLFFYKQRVGLGRLVSNDNFK